MSLFFWTILVDDITWASGTERSYKAAVVQASFAMRNMAEILEVQANTRIVVRFS